MHSFVSMCKYHYRNNIPEVKWLGLIRSISFIQVISRQLCTSQLIGRYQIMPATTASTVYQNKIQTEKDKCVSITVKAIPKEYLNGRISVSVAVLFGKVPFTSSPGDATGSKQNCYVRSLSSEQVFPFIDFPSPPVAVTFLTFQISHHFLFQ